MSLRRTTAKHKLICFNPTHPTAQYLHVNFYASMMDVVHPNLVQIAESFACGLLVENGIALFAGGPRGLVPTKI